jgi:hypothetical protein
VVPPPGTAPSAAPPSAAASRAAAPRASRTLPAGHTAPGGAASASTPSAPNASRSPAASTWYGRATTGAPALLAASSRAAPSSPQRSAHRPTSHAGCEWRSASASSASAGSAGSRPAPSGPALAVHPPQHGVGERPGAAPVAALGQLHRLVDGRVRRHAPHRHELLHAQPQQVDEVGVERDEPAAHAPFEHRVHPRAAPQQPVDELLQPPPVAPVERGGVALERRVEQVPGAQVGEHLGRGRARGRDAAPARGRAAAGPRGRAGAARRAR